MKPKFFVAAALLAAAPLATVNAQDFGDTVIVPEPVAEPVPEIADTGPAPQVPAEGGSYYEAMDYIAEPLGSTEDIVTEAEFADNYVNYLAPPESVETVALYPSTVPEFATAVELALEMKRLEQAAGECARLRRTLEERIGNNYGSYSVETQWVKKYQNCVMTRRSDIAKLAPSITNARQAAIETLGDEGATLEFEFLDKLAIRYSDIRRTHEEEVRLKSQFVAYYNSGVKGY